MTSQLVYVYIKKLRDCFENQEFCFTSDFYINFQENHLSIKEDKNPYKGLWGEKIYNINLIIGKNGSGKTTLLDLLGSTKRRRQELFLNQRKDVFEWFAVYHIKDNLFVIEGNNPYLIKNIKNIPKGTSEEYSLCIKYNFKKGNAEYDDYIQFIENEQYRLNETSSVLYLANNNKKKWFSNNDFIDEDDNYVGFRRSYLNKPQFANLYSFMSKEYEIIEKNFTAKNCLCEIKIKDDSYITDRKHVKKSLALNLYNDKEKILLFKSDFRIKTYGKEKEIEKWTKTEKFILRYLELVVIHVWENLIEKKIKEWEIRGLKELEIRGLMEMIEKFDAMDDNFKTRVNYLRKLLHDIYTLNEKFNKDYSLKAYFHFVYRFTEKIKSLDVKYFKLNNILSIEVNKGYDVMVHELLEIYDINEDEIQGLLDVKFRNMSTGEIELVNGFSNLYTAVNIGLNNKQVSSILLLLDEPDASFHPEWSRKYIDSITKFLNQVSFGRVIKFQIIISTHSPFIVSDIPKEHIICIDVIEDELGNLHRIAKKSNFGFMSNFYDIIQSDFFMSSSIGEFAKSVFDDIIKRINGWKEYDREEIEKVESIISSIGEKIIKMKLEQMVKDKNLELMPQKQKKFRIKELEFELAQLKENLDVVNND